MNQYIRPMILAPFAALALIGLAACSSGGIAPSTPAAPTPPPPGEARAAFLENVPRAQCGPGDRPETGLQGQVPLVDRMSGASLQAYTCNLELVGQTGWGGAYSFATFDDCAYYSTLNNHDQPADEYGVQVVDVSDSANPVTVNTLNQLGMNAPHESLTVHEARTLMAGVQNNNTGFSIFDISSDCTSPQLLAETNMPDGNGHAGNIAKDGLTYYGASLGSNLYAIDISDPANPTQLANYTDDFTGNTHNLNFNDDGTRLYLTHQGNALKQTPIVDNGLVIVDSTEIQTRQPDPELHVVGQMLWDEGSLVYSAMPVTIGGKSMIIIGDESGTTGLAGYDQACAQGVHPFAMVRILDISDETDPKLVSRLRLESQDPANCEQAIMDAPASDLFLYDSHACTVDRQVEPTIAICGLMQAGLRVFDIRDPYLPKELAYYIPPSNPGPRGGSSFGFTGVCGTGDWVLAHAWLKPEKNEIWFQTACNGFQAIRFTNGVWPFEG